MLKKISGKILLRKLRVVSTATDDDARQSEKEEFTKVTTKNSTTLDITVLAVLTTFVYVLSQGMPTVFDNRKDRK